MDCANEALRIRWVICLLCFLQLGCIGAAAGQSGRESPDIHDATVSPQTSIIEQTISSANSPPRSVQSAQIDHVIATGTLGGTFNEAGVSFANLFNTSNCCAMRMGLTPLATSGTRVNIELLLNRKVKLAIVESYAAKTSPLADRTRRLRTVSALWPEVLHFLLNSNLVSSGDMSDLATVPKGSIYLGAQNSGTLVTSHTVLTALGIDSDGIGRVSDNAYSQVVGQLIAGEIEGASLSGGMPVNAVKQAMSALEDSMHLLSFTRGQQEKIRQSLGAEWQPYTIDPNTYPGLSKPVQTLAQPVYLVADEEVRPEFIHRLLELLLSEVSSRGGVGSHPALTSLTTVSAFPDTVLYPLHDGTCQFAAERRIESVIRNAQSLGCHSALNDAFAADQQATEPKR